MPTTLLKATVRPSTAVQQGVGTIGGGAANVAAAFADENDLTYVEINQRCRLDSEVVRVGFPTPTLPAGARVYSVEIRRKELEVPDADSQQLPVCLHWHRCAPGTATVAGQRPEVRRRHFTTPSPTALQGATPSFVEVSLGEYRTGPDGEPWDTTANLAAYHPTTNPGGFTYDIGRDDSHATTLRVSAVYLDVYYQRQSVVTVTGPTSPNSDTRPTITWLYASDDSQPQRSYRVAIYTAAQVAALGFAPFETQPLMASGTQVASKADSWWQLGEDLQWTLTGDLIDGTYHAYVQATSRWAGAGDEFTTPVDSITWTRVSAPADPPPAAVLQSALFDPALGAVALTFASGGPTPATTAFTVQYSADNEVTWLTDPALTHIPASGTASQPPVYHRFYSLKVGMAYRVVAFSQTVLVAAAEASNVLTVTPTGDRHRLVHPLNPLLDTVLPVAAPKQAGEGITVTLPRMMAIYQLIGGAGQRVLQKFTFGPDYGRVYDLTSFFADEDLAELYPALDALTNAASELWFQHPDGTAEWVVIGPGASGRDTEEQFDVTPGDPTEIDWRRRRYTLTQVDPPLYY